MVHILSSFSKRRYTAAKLLGSRSDKADTARKLAAGFTREIKAIFAKAKKKGLPTISTEDFRKVEELRVSEKQ
jgi:hypothetical protein